MSITTEKFRVLLVVEAGSEDELNIFDRLLCELVAQMDTIEVTPVDDGDAQARNAVARWLNSSRETETNQSADDKSRVPSGTTIHFSKFP